MYSYLARQRSVLQKSKIFCKSSIANKQKTYLCIKQYRDFRGIHVCGIVYTLTHKCCIVCHLCGTHKLFFLNFDNDTYAQNSEIIKAIRIQKNFFKILIGKSFSKIDPLSSLTDTTIVV